MRSKVNLTRLMQYSAKLCETIGAETGQDVGWRNVGSLDPPRQQRCALGGVQARRDRGEKLRLRPRADRRRTRSKDSFPLVDLKDVRGATWIASDGYVDPVFAHHGLREGRAGRAA